MKLSELGMQPLLRISSALIVLGLGIEILSLLWFHPLSFVLFATAGTVLIGLGILVYLASVVYVARPANPADKQTQYERDVPRAK